MAGIVAGSLLGLTDLQQPKTLNSDRVIAREVMVRDGERLLLAMLSADPKVNGLSLTHVKTGAVAALQTVQGTSGLYLDSPTIGSVLFGQSAERAGFVSLTPRGASEPSVQIASEREGGNLIFHDRDAGLLCSTGVGQEGPFFVARKGDARVALIIRKQGPSLGIKDSAGRTRVWADLDPTVRAGLRVLDGEGRARVLFSVEDGAGPDIRLNDSSERASWCAGVKRSR